MHRSTLSPKWVLALVLLAAWIAPPAAADDAKSLMSDVWNRFRQAKSETESSEILVISSPPEAFHTRDQVRELIASPPSNVKHKRATREVAYDVDGTDKTHVLFSLPAEDAGLGLLILSNVAEPTDRMWLYMPGYRSVRQLPASNTQRFADTDLLYEDVRAQTGERTAYYDYSIERTADHAGRPCTVVEATPTDAVKTSYGRRVFWIDEEWRFPVRVELYDRSGELWKVLQNSEVKEVSPGIRRADLVEMRDLKRKSATVLMTTERKLGADIPSRVFTQDYLEHPDTP